MLYDDSESNKEILGNVLQSACPKCEVMIYDLNAPRIAAQSADIFERIIQPQKP